VTRWALRMVTTCACVFWRLSSVVVPVAVMGMLVGTSKLRRVD